MLLRPAGDPSGKCQLSWGDLPPLCDNYATRGEVKTKPKFDTSCQSNLKHYSPWVGASFRQVQAAGLQQHKHGEVREPPRNLKEPGAARLPLGSRGMGAGASPLFEAVPGCPQQLRRVKAPGCPPAPRTSILEAAAPGTGAGGRPAARPASAAVQDGGAQGPPAPPGKRRRPPPGAAHARVAAGTPGGAREGGRGLPASRGPGSGGP